MIKRATGIQTEGGRKVMVVDGTQVRSSMDPGFNKVGTAFRQSCVPANEIWVEAWVPMDEWSSVAKEAEATAPQVEAIEEPELEKKAMLNLGLGRLAQKAGKALNTATETVANKVGNAAYKVAKPVVNKVTSTPAYKKRVQPIVHKVTSHPAYRKAVDVSTRPIPHGGKIKAGIGAASFPIPGSGAAFPLARATAKPLANRLRRSAGLEKLQWFLRQSFNDFMEKHAASARGYPHPSLIREAIKEAAVVTGPPQPPLPPHPKPLPQAIPRPMPVPAPQSAAQGLAAPMPPPTAPAPAAPIPGAGAIPQATAAGPVPQPKPPPPTNMAVAGNTKLTQQKVEQHKPPMKPTMAKVTMTNAVDKVTPAKVSGGSSPNANVSAPGGSSKSGGMKS